MESGKNQLSLLMKYQWVGDANKDVKKVLNINSSPYVDEAFKMFLYTLAIKSNKTLLGKEHESVLEVFACPFEIADKAKNVVDISELYSEKIQSLVSFCELTEFVLIRFTVEK